MFPRRIDDIKDGLFDGLFDEILLGAADGSNDGFNDEEGISDGVVLGAIDKQGALGSSKYISGELDPSLLLSAIYPEDMYDVDRYNIRSSPSMRSVISKVTYPTSVFLVPGVGLVIVMLGPSTSTSCPVLRRLSHLTPVSVQSFGPILLTVTSKEFLVLTEDTRHFR